MLITDTPIDVFEPFLQIVFVRYLRNSKGGVGIRGYDRHDDLSEVPNTT